MADVVEQRRVEHAQRDREQPFELHGGEVQHVVDRRYSQLRLVVAARPNGAQRFAVELLEHAYLQVVHDETGVGAHVGHNGRQRFQVHREAGEHAPV